MSGIKFEYKQDGQWCGFGFGVMSIPNRKSKALYKTRGCMTEVLAYFKSDDDAEDFQFMIDKIIEVVGSRLKNPELLKQEEP